MDVHSAADNSNNCSKFRRNTVVTFVHLSYFSSSRIVLDQFGGIHTFIGYFPGLAAVLNTDTNTAVLSTEPRYRYCTLNTAVS
jgi:hypothetical protein